MNFLDYLVVNGMANRTSGGIEISNNLSVQNLNLLKKQYERGTKEAEAGKRKKKVTD